MKENRIYNRYCSWSSSYCTNSKCFKTNSNWKEDSEEEINCESVQGEGEAEVLAITSCPSGVAHTFLAAKALEKTATKLGVKIKVETQGANGIVNRITPKM